MPPRGCRSCRSGESWRSARLGRRGSSRHRRASSCPPPLRPARPVLDWARGKGASVMVTEDPGEAVHQADCVVSDAWVSMHDAGEGGGRHNLLAPYQVNAGLMRQAKADALFMHCLPAHRGEEVTDEVIDGPQSVVWDEAENRLHAQKSILTWCLGA